MRHAKEWIFVPRIVSIELSEDESYERFLLLMHELGEERGQGLTNKQVDALQKVIAGLIEADARIKVYDAQ